MFLITSILQKFSMFSSKITVVLLHFYITIKDLANYIKVCKFQFEVFKSNRINKKTGLGINLKIAFEDIS